MMGRVRVAPPGDGDEPRDGEGNGENQRNGRRAQDSIVQMIRLWWPLLVSCFTIGAGGGGVFSSYVVAPRQVREQSAKIESLARDLEAHTLRMGVNRDSVLVLVGHIASQVNLLVLDRCMSPGERMMKRQLRCDRDP